MSYCPLLNEILSILTLRLQKLPLLQLSTLKTWILKKLTKIMLVLTLFIQRADNLANRIILTFVN